MSDSTQQSVLLAHPGTQYAPRLASELERRGLLKRYWTSIAFARNGAADRCSRFLPGPLRRAVASRVVDGVPKCKLRTIPAVELASVARMRCGAGTEDALNDRNQSFQRCIPASEIDDADAVIGFDTSSSILAQRCATKDKPFLLDQSIGHPVAKQRIYSSLRHRYSEWDVEASLKHADLIEIERREHELAQLIVAPSQFVKRTLIDEGVSEEKIRINPFGVDLDVFSPSEKLPSLERIVFLFAGAISVRKGFPFLLDVWRRAELTNAELWIVGDGTIPTAALPLPPGVALHGRLGRRELANLMRKAHAFIFPSFFEGLAQVQIEALASGLPVLGTLESGATEIVADRVEGRILPSGNVDAWVSALHELANNPDVVVSMRSAALRKRPALSWSAYGDRYAAILKETN